MLCSKPFRVTYSDFDVHILNNKKETHHFRQENGRVLIQFSFRSSRKKQNTHKFINKRSGCPVFSLFEGNYFAVKGFAQSEYQFRTKSQQVVFVGDD